MSVFEDRSVDAADEPEGEGAQLLDQVAAMLARYIAFPSPAALTAVALWAAHCHAVAAFESTPRLALLSPEKGSGKTRALEVLELLVPRPMHAVNATAAALFRAVEAHQPTLLFDEADTYFGPMARGEHEELGGLVNAGHRKGAVAYRCVGEPARMEVKAFPAFCAVAIAGIGDLAPDDSRPRRAHPHAPTGTGRAHRTVPAPQGRQGRRRAARGPGRLDEGSRRPARRCRARDAGRAGGPARRRVGSATGHRRHGQRRLADPGPQGRPGAERRPGRADPSLGIALLRDTRAVFDGAEALATEELLKRLTALDESPWGDLRGKPLDARGLARRLKPYEVRPTTVRVGDATPKGYRREDLHDAWTRYLPGTPKHPQHPKHRRPAPLPLLRMLRTLRERQAAAPCSTMTVTTRPGGDGE